MQDIGWRRRFTSSNDQSTPTSSWGTHWECSTYGRPVRNPIMMSQRSDMMMELFMLATTFWYFSRASPLQFALVALTRLHSLCAVGHHRCNKKNEVR